MLDLSLLFSHSSAEPALLSKHHKRAGSSSHGARSIRRGLSGIRYRGQCRARGSRPSCCPRSSRLRLRVRMHVRVCVREGGRRCHRVGHTVNEAHALAGVEFFVRGHQAEGSQAAALLAARLWRAQVVQVLIVFRVPRHARLLGSVRGKGVATWAWGWVAPTACTAGAAGGGQGEGG